MQFLPNSRKRLLELTKTISATSSNKQVLDKLKVERERGITVKAQVSRFLMPKENLLLYSLVTIDCIHVLQLQGQRLSSQSD